MRAIGRMRSLEQRLQTTRVERAPGGVWTGPGGRTSEIGRMQEGVRGGRGAPKALGYNALEAQGGNHTLQGS